MEKPKKIIIQERDIRIFNFLDRVGYANIEQIAEFTETTKTAVLQRVYQLVKFSYLHIFYSANGNYYGLTRKTKGENTLITSINYNQLPHHDFLTNLFLVVKDTENTMSEREAIAKYKVVGRKGKIPDMIIQDVVIEYERTNKSTTESQELVNYWLSQNARLVIIYDSEQIKNRYTSLISSSNIQLISRLESKNILSIINNFAETSDTKTKYNQYY
jgi:hypothetical protein